MRVKYAPVKWMLTIAYRSRPANSEWQYKTVIARNPPEIWLADRLARPEHGEHPILEANVLYAREITDEAAAVLERVLHDR